jgi:hypothetical protein
MNNYQPKERKDPQDTDEKGIFSQIPPKSRGSLGNILKTFILINWKIYKR